jgi:serine/threonine-protein kinase
LKPEELIGKRIANYQILAYVGKGAVGAVYRAADVSTGEVCALKLLPQHAAHGDDVALTRLSREAQALARLRHPNIVRGLGCGRAGGFYYFAMEFVSGESLEDLYRRQGRIREPAALLIAVNVARALQHAYAQGVIHRDIKPANILITKSGAVKVTDFGMAKSERVKMPGRKHDTPLQVAIGTPRYMSPEQARGEKVLDIRADIYSLGITLWTVLAGRFPYEGTAPEIMAQHLSALLPPLPRFAPDVSEATTRAVERMTAKRPQDRYQTPGEMLVDLVACLLALKTPYPSPGEPSTAVLTSELLTGGAPGASPAAPAEPGPAPEAEEEPEAEGEEVDIDTVARPPEAGPDDDVFCFTRGPAAGGTFILREGGQVVLGRDPVSADVAVDDEVVSRRHCLLARRRGIVTVTDLDTTNGTYVNGRLVQSRVLQPGDEISFGETRLRRKT